MTFIHNTIYLVPGRGNKLNEIGDFITSVGFDVCGRELLPPFYSLHFSKQCNVIKKDLMSLFWHNDAKLNGHSFGGYLLLHALSELEPFPGKILLFSPVIGSMIAKNLFSSRPPRADKLLNLAKNSKYPIPKSLYIHTGADDDGCDPDLARIFGEKIPSAIVNIIPNQGHKLCDHYVKMTILEFLKVPHE